MSKNILFITESLFKERTGASTAIDGKQLFPIIKVAADMHIQTALGSQLYIRLQDGIDQNNLTVTEKYLLDYYITDCLIWYTMSMLPFAMGYQLFSKGFLQKTSEESQTPSRADLELIEQKYLSMAEFYKTRLIKYLQQNYTSFNEYFNLSSGLDVIFPEEKAYTSPIYLGDYGGRRQVSSASGFMSVSYANYLAVGGETTFLVAALSGKTLLSVTRGGLAKVIVSTPTADTNYLQVNASQITLPTGDMCIAGETFTFLYK